ncbi:PEP-CTERM protein-sorting domain-containing protein [Desulfonatronum zhilinae]|nr:PEP-CTERM protein-sorting domain-containing protein [Desulfonatronum zhilinae]
MKPKLVLIIAIAAFTALFSPSPGLALPILGDDLASFSVLGASTVTNVPTSTIVGSVGVWSSGGANAITGFISEPGVAVSDPQVTSGNVHAGTALAELAQGQLTTAITNLGSLGTGTLLAEDLAGLTLFPGVYTVPAGTTNLSGTLTLDGQGNANAAWVFQMPSTLITSPNSVVNMINTGSSAGLFWNVGSSATIDVNTTFKGNILAYTSISLNTVSTVLCGRALANNGAVTLQQNSLSGCLSGGLDVDGTVVTFLPYESIGNGGNGGIPPIPEPSTWLLFATGLLCLMGFSRKKFRSKAE